jgi:hypothetical protein
MRIYNHTTEQSDTVENILQLDAADRAKAIVNHIEMTITSVPTDEQMERYTKLVESAIARERVVTAEALCEAMEDTFIVMIRGMAKELRDTIAAQRKAQ